MNKRILESGTKMYFGAPAHPMPETTANAIAKAVAQVPGIVEAHLPQCFVEGDQNARQILVVGTQMGDDIPRIAQELTGKLQLVLPPGLFIDILPLESGKVPQEVRQAGCQIFARGNKAWWKRW